MNIHEITRAIAREITHDPMTRHATVYLGAIPEEVELGELTIVVTPQSVNHEQGAGREYSVQLFIAMDESRRVANIAAPEKTSDGYYTFGVDGNFDALLEYLEHALGDWDLGAIPAGVQIEYDYSAVPYRAAVVTATYRCIQTF